MRKILFKVLCCVVPLILVFAALPAKEAKAAFPSASMVCADAAGIGDEFSVAVTLSSDNLGAAESILSYDTEYLQYIDGTNAGLFDTGKVKLAAVVSSHGQTSVSMTVNFRALKFGMTSLSLGGTHIIDYDTEAEIGSPSFLKKIVIRTESGLKTLSSISVSKLPDKNVYYKNDVFDSTGIGIRAVYGDGSFDDVTQGALISGFTSLSSGPKTVTAEYNGKTVSFSSYVFAFKSVSLSLTGKIVINFYADFPSYSEEGYDPGILFFRHDPSEADILAAYAAGNGVTDFSLSDDRTTLAFSYDDIAAKEMNDRVYAVLFAKLADGSVVYGSPSSISAAQYVTLAFNTYSNTKLRRMLVDMLNYGSMAQQQFAYNTGSLANSGLTSEQKSLASTGSPALSSSMKLYNDALTSENVSIVSASLSLENEIAINFYASVTGEVSSASLLIFDSYTNGGTYDKDTALKTVNMMLSGNYYSGSIPNIPAKAMRNKYYARIHVVFSDGSEAYSGIGQYSVETYAHTVKNGSSYSAKLKSLTDAMMKYGDSAAAYFAD